MLTNCGKPVKNTAQKYAKNSCIKNVKKSIWNKKCTFINKFCQLLGSFNQPKCTRNFKNFNLLKGEFCQFYTYTTNTTINIGRD